MGKKVYIKTALTGGAAGALDEIDGSLLNNLDIAIVTVSGTVYFYVLNHDLTTAESSPGIISPDKNYGTKRWVLQIDGIMATSKLYWDDVNGRLGIGTAAPDERLTLIVADNSGDCKLKVGNNLTNKNGVLGYSDGNDFLYVQGGVWGGTTRQLNLQGGGGNVCVGAFSATGAKLSVDGGLNVGAGNDPGDNNLVVQGTAYIYGTLDAGLGGSTGTTMVYSGTRIYWNNSSERFKEDITRNWKSGKLADYLKISPIKFKPKREIGDHNGDPVNSYALGFSAEEVHASGVPGLINYDKEEKPMSLREHGFLVYHHLILQEFEKRIAALEGR